jgi:hypothetical protein
MALALGGGGGHVLQDLLPCCVRPQLVPRGQPTKSSIIGRGHWRPVFLLGW